MYPKQHFFSGMIFALFLLIIFPQIKLIGFFIIVLSTVLFDVDHYLYYVYKKKDFSLRNAYNWFDKEMIQCRSISREQRNNSYACFPFLHGIEILVISFLLVFTSKYFLFIFAGLSLHLLIDIVYQTTYWDRMDKISVLYDFFKFKKLNYIG